MPDDIDPQDPTPETPPNDDTTDPEPDEERSQQDLEIERLKTLVGEQETELISLRGQIEFSVGRYRIALIAGAPDLPEELIKGATIPELDEAMDSARKIVDKVASSIKDRIPGGRVPSGAPVRSPADLSGLSAREKIMYAINKN